MKNQRRLLSKPIPVKLDEELLARVKALAKDIGEAESTVMRLCMKAGLPKLEAAFSKGEVEDVIAALKNPDPNPGPYPEHNPQIMRVEDAPKPPRRKTA